ncbi:MAG TPA: AMP-binding protein, partial [Chitinophaga sp.]|uniref:AMP-binding protein n=1 Tax=Chitinophaga sp. TaxID=1869181 RepID=UPI002CE7C61C
MKTAQRPITLNELLIRLKNEQEKGITFISSGNKEEFLSYGRLYETALRWLGHLQDNGMQPGDELILQIEDNRVFLQVFWACILGGMIPVPVAVTHQGENAQKLFNISAVLKHPFLMVSRAYYEKLGKQQDVVGKFEKILFIEDGEVAEGQGTIHPATPEKIAFLQFSSGSTGNPKGVVLMHSNLIANIYSALAANECTNEDRMLSWMPLTHDMGLICFHLYPLAAGIPQALMPTDLFIRHPMLWLQKAGEHRATITGSPNFGYKYCLDQFSEEKVKGLDLSDLRIIYNGAEPIAALLCRRFMDKLSVYNLRESAMRPGYGLAEATLKVSFTRDIPSLKSLFIQRESLTIGHAIKTVNTGQESAGVLEVVNVGHVIDDMYLKITNEKGYTLEDGHAGIIWISGPSVTTRYYNNEAASSAVIKPDGWLNTGDVGFLLNGYLYVVGRVKDIIIVNGLNVYPHDIEQAVEKLE